MSATAKLTAVESKLLVRDPGSMFSFLIPVFILVVFGLSLPAGDTTLLPTTLSIAIGLVGLYLIPTTLATYREKGILRRLSITPVRPVSLLFVQLLLQFLLAVVSCAALLIVAAIVLGARLPANLVGFGWVFVLGTASMFAIGLLIAALASSGRVANGIGVLLYFPMAFLAGLMQPAAMMPSVLVRIGELTPLGALRKALGEVWAGGSPSVLPMLVMGAYALVVSVAAAKLFRWE